MKQIRTRQINLDAGKRVTSYYMEACVRLNVKVYDEYLMSLQRFTTKCLPLM